jgi:hypothetical protein
MRDGQWRRSRRKLRALLPTKSGTAPQRHTEAATQGRGGEGQIHEPECKFGYVRVSTLDQNLALQQDALREAGCQKVFVEQTSGAVTYRPALREAHEYARSGDAAQRRSRAAVQTSRSAEHVKHQDAWRWRSVDRLGEAPEADAA